ncbi:hypothetical protein KCP71_06725 [Salmonella enterica subsp. enterica]|nr:hypothetical protein KCP71_06725 [Salmonella enterica subsp. enterica]
MRHVIKTRRGTDALLTAHEQPPQKFRSINSSLAALWSRIKQPLMTLCFSMSNITFAVTAKSVLICVASGYHIEMSKIKVSSRGEPSIIKISPPAR